MEPFPFVFFCQFYRSGTNEYNSAVDMSAFACMATREQGFHFWVWPKRQHQITSYDRLYLKPSFFYYHPHNIYLLLSSIFELILSNTRFFIVRQYGIIDTLKTRNVLFWFLFPSGNNASTITDSIPHTINQAGGASFSSFACQNIIK